MGIFGRPHHPRHSRSAAPLPHAAPPFPANSPPVGAKPPTQQPAAGASALPRPIGRKPAKACRAVCRRCWKRCGGARDFAARRAAGCTRRQARGVGSRGAAAPEPRTASRGAVQRGCDRSTPRTTAPEPRASRPGDRAAGRSRASPHSRGGPRRSAATAAAGAVRRRGARLRSGDASRPTLATCAGCRASAPTRRGHMLGPTIVSASSGEPEAA